MDIDKSQRIFELNMEINTLDWSIALLNKQIKMFYAEKDKLVEELELLELEVKDSKGSEKRNEEMNRSKIGCRIGTSGFEERACIFCEYNKEPSSCLRFIETWGAEIMYREKRGE